MLSASVNTDAISVMIDDVNARSTCNIHYRYTHGGS